MVLDFDTVERVSLFGSLAPHDLEAIRNRMRELAKGNFAKYRAATNGLKDQRRGSNAARSIGKMN